MDNDILIFSETHLIQQNVFILGDVGQILWPQILILNVIIT